jgi:allantoicase
MRASSKISAAVPKIFKYSRFCYNFMWSLVSASRLRNSSMCSWSVISIVMNLRISSCAIWMVWFTANFVNTFRSLRLKSISDSPVELIDIRDYCWCAIVDVLRLEFIFK